MKQWQQALANANRVRSGRARVRRGLRDGSLTLEQALSDPDAAGMKLTVLLESQYWWGPYKSRRLLRELALVDCRVEQLSRQRVGEVLQCVGLGSRKEMR